ncbi:hypothetical protein BASA61_003657 [Batrachochytrium salamandrivorans]|nr:hypothetical protein BASA61_003657 [Batrachochytrium salamandrivorans]
MRLLRGPSPSPVISKISSVIHDAGLTGQHHDLLSYQPPRPSQTHICPLISHVSLPRMSISSSRAGAHSLFQHEPSFFKLTAPDPNALTTPFASVLACCATIPTATVAFDASYTILVPCTTTDDYYYYYYTQYCF